MGALNLARFSEGYPFSCEYLRREDGRDRGDRFLVPLSPPTGDFLPEYSSRVNNINKNGIFLLIFEGLERKRWKVKRRIMLFD